MTLPFSLIGQSVTTFWTLLRLEEEVFTLDAVLVVEDLQRSPDKVLPKVIKGRTWRFRMRSSKYGLTYNVWADTL